MARKRLNNAHREIIVRYLMQKYKESIKDITAHVEKLKQDLTIAVEEMVAKKFPLEDMVILQKYNLVTYRDTVYVIIDHEYEQLYFNSMRIMPKDQHSSRVQLAADSVIATTWKAYNKALEAEHELMQNIDSCKTFEDALEELPFLTEIANKIYTTGQAILIMSSTLLASIKQAILIMSSTLLASIKQYFHS
jgi:hypothetical protein